MREIKFRAWDNVKSEMYYVGEEGNISFGLDSNGIVAYDITEGEEEFKVLHHLQYMQYTGLKDHNGKEIYEGDILKESVEHGDIITQVVFKDYSWKEKLISSPRNHLRDYFPFGHVNVTVIGNIYENKELLEGE
ncbi:YopX family protein [Bacillus cytotoxicus]|uniref:YopX protein domain-containing protein n=1 Tax=Bacillus cytotoxicus (strain DSM 22905 / CIP 110041 / 391-98 / NVH 391-98) TaxID=315749 RepID=A7GSS8_BACCN|nr:YopX family protein [Bacillus cytotoxicus]ABS23186.1 conserved hypothetical protein [Bacillus cytotoxicus NVH 391-98]MDH2866469.1 YopX family protein [Bacillus cytotoxicus]NZD32597.1 hypothetical protein [Bacillus cytotoxicus]NZD32643.1 hypothetical protein [Bacillus cytotoxicus]HDR7211283.1 hypothetical protein [Bacillus cytotoxicus]